MLQVQGPDFIAGLSPDKNSEAVNTFEQPQSQPDPSHYANEDYGIYRFLSPGPTVGFQNLGGLSPQATGVVDHHGIDLNYWNTGGGDVDMLDVVSRHSRGVVDPAVDGQAGQLNMAHLTPHHSIQQTTPFEDVEMVGLGFEGLNTNGDHFGVGTPVYSSAGYQPTAPLRDQADNDDDDAMGDNRPVQRDTQGWEESNTKAPKDRADQPMDEEESADEREELEKTTPNEGGGGTRTDTQGDERSGETGTDEEERPNITVASLRKRETANSMKIGGKVAKKPVRRISARRAKASQKTVISRPKAIAEDEEDEPADNIAADEANESDPTERTTIFEELADGIWISTRRYTLDSEERVKLGCDTVIDAYGVSGSKIPVRINVHVRA